MLVTESVAMVRQAKSLRSHFTSTRMAVTTNRLKITSVGDLESLC